VVVHGHTVRAKPTLRANPDRHLTGPAASLVLEETAYRFLTVWWRRRICSDRALAAAYAESGPTGFERSVGLPEEECSLGALTEGTSTRTKWPARMSKSTIGYAQHLGQGRLDASG
jgi:hypothetical protein